MQAPPAGPQEDSLQYRFGASGWHLESSILETRTVRAVRALLEARLGDLDERFASWIGLPDYGRDQYREHQQLLPQYDARGLPKDLRHYLCGEFDLDTRLNPTILELLEGEGCRRRLCGFLQAPRYLVHYPPMIRFKLRDAPSNMVPVHQDSAYNDHLRDFITAWVPLVDIDDACGGVIVYEGSHLGDQVEHSASGAWAARAHTDLSGYSRRHVLMSAGDALLFPPRLLHESAPHRADWVRYSIDFRIFRTPADTRKSYYDPFDRETMRLH